MDITSTTAAKIKGRTCSITARTAQGNRVPGSRAYRAWMIQGFYEGGDVPGWVAVAEQNLRDLFRANGLSAKQFPPTRTTTGDEQSVWQFFGRTIEWLWDDDERLSAHRLLEEAIRRVGDAGGLQSCGAGWVAEQAPGGQMQVAGRGNQRARQF